MDHGAFNLPGVPMQLSTNSTGHTVPVAPNTGAPAMVDMGEFGSPSATPQTPNAPQPGAPQPGAQGQPQPQGQPEPFNPFKSASDLLRTPQQQTVAAPLPGQPQIPPGARDYTKFPEKLVPFLKHLPNAEFARAQELAEYYANAEQYTKIKPEYEAMKTTNPLHFMHEEAFQLAPEYKQMDQQFTAYNNVANFFREQLAAYQTGKPWISITWDQQGNPIRTQQQALATGTAPDQSIVTSLTQGMVQYDMKAQETSTKFQNWVHNWKQGYGTARQAVDEVTKTLMPDYADISKLPKEKQELFEKGKQLIPASMRYNPLADTVGRCVVIITDLQNRVKELTATTSAAPGSAGVGAPLPGQTLPGGSNMVNASEFTG